MNNGTDTRSELREALRALRDRSVDDAESVLNSTSADNKTVIRTCEWWDRQPAAKRTSGLLVWKLRQGGVPEDDTPVSKTARMRHVFDAYIQKHPVGSRLCSHAALSARKWPDDRCDCVGQIRVVVASFPVLEMECDVCGFDAALTPRAMTKEVMA